MTRRFEITNTPLTEVRLLRRRIITDERGFLERLFCAEELEPLFAGKRIVQINRTLTARRGSVRGMHFQVPPHAEAKLVTCLRGKIFDVAVDVRKASPTFLKWHGEVLEAGEATALLIPEGFAHGFQTLADGCEVLYLHTARYEPAAEGAINPRDPLVGIKWPEVISEISERDASHSMLTSGAVGVEI